MAQIHTPRPGLLSAAQHLRLGPHGINIKQEQGVEPGINEPTSFDSFGTSVDSTTFPSRPTPPLTGQEAMYIDINFSLPDASGMFP